MDRCLKPQYYQDWSHNILKLSCFVAGSARFFGSSLNDMKLLAVGVDSEARLNVAFLEAVGL